MWSKSQTEPNKKMLSSHLIIQQWGVTILCLLLFAVQSGSAIKCWECNSKYDSRCGDPFSNFSVAQVDCDQKVAEIDHVLDGYTVGEGGQPMATLCRKSYQMVDGEVRIIRGCGWVHNTGFVKDRTCFNRAGTHQVQLLHCVCSEDGCNAASTMKLSHFLALFLPLIPAILMLNY